MTAICDIRTPGTSRFGLVADEVSQGFRQGDYVSDSLSELSHSQH